MVDRTTENIRFRNLSNDDMKRLLKISNSEIELGLKVGVRSDFVYDELVRRGLHSHCGVRHMTLWDRLNFEKLFSGTKLTLLESYLVGYFLGDGTYCRGNGCIKLVCDNSRDKWLLRDVFRQLDCPTAVGWQRGRLDRIQVTISPFLVQRLAALGLEVRSKRLLPEGSKMCVWDKLDFIMAFRGLIDTDGTVIRVAGEGRRLVVSLTCLPLLELVYAKLVDLGCPCRYSVKNYGHKDVGTLLVPLAGVDFLLKKGFYRDYPGLCCRRKRLGRCRRGLWSVSQWKEIRLGCGKLVQVRRVK